MVNSSTPPPFVCLLHSSPNPLIGCHAVRQRAVWSSARSTMPCSRKIAPPQYLVAYHSCHSHSCRDCLARYNSLLDENREGRWAEMHRERDKEIRRRRKRREKRLRQRVKALKTQAKKT